MKEKFTISPQVLSCMSSEYRMYHSSMSFARREAQRTVGTPPDFVL
jgi:hypothetical protein